MVEQQAITSAPPSSRLKSFWQRRVVSLIVAQLKQGVSPEKIAFAMALGVTLALFPIIGSTTFLCLTFGVWFKLNQPVIQLVNWLASPLQLIFIPIFVRFGEWLTRAQPVPFSIPELFRKFHESPVKFMHEFGMTGLRGIGAWCVVAPLLLPALYYCFRPPLRKLAALTRSDHAG